MSEATRSLPLTRAARADAFAPPPFVRELAAASQQVLSMSAGEIVRASGAGGSLFSVRVVEASRLDAASFSAAVAQAYEALYAAAREAGVPQMIRIWNGIPSIHERLDGGGIDRYMAFNAGRYAAMRAWYGHDSELASRVPAASGVGVSGDDLIIHAWAVYGDARPIQNDRQVPATAYSSRYGPLPPCFARATLASIAGEPMLLVSGTAAILGEDSAHSGDLAAQCELTCTHLARLVVLAGFDARNALDAYVSLRVYVPRGDDEGRLRDEIAPRFPRVRTIEFVRAQLCRRELLVEIEGIARPLERMKG